jgi:predicted dehydrogenase
MRLRVGLVGLGDAWEQRHRPALRALADRFEVRAVCEQVHHRAELAAREFGAAAVDSFRALARREDIDAILILSSPWYGSLPILAACETGKAVYFGAGFNLQPEEARRIKARVEEAGIAFMAEFPRRHWAATLRLKELIATRLGCPRLVFCHHRLSTPGCAHPIQPQRFEGPNVQDLVELVDWCRYVVGKEPGWVTGMMHNRGADAGEEDYQMMSLDFSGRDAPGTGPVAQISCGRYFPSRWHEAITYRPLTALQVACERGIAFVDFPAVLVWFDEAGRQQETLDSERPVGELLLTQFHRAVTSLVRKTCDLEDACRALFIVEQARRSHREGRRMPL